jgi:hypothetical protein
MIASQAEGANTSLRMMFIGLFLCFYFFSDTLLNNPQRFETLFKLFNIEAKG